MKDNPRESFRWAPHMGGQASVKVRDYLAGESLDAANPYEAWKRLAEAGTPLRPGDLLEVNIEEEMIASDVAAAKPAELWIAMYIGFQPARWFVPEAVVLAAAAAEAVAPAPPLS